MDMLQRGSAVLIMYLGLVLVIANTSRSVCMCVYASIFFRLQAKQTHFEKTITNRKLQTRKRITTSIWRGHVLLPLPPSLHLLTSAAYCPWSVVRDPQWHL